MDRTGTKLSLFRGVLAQSRVKTKPLAPQPQGPWGPEASSRAQKLGGGGGYLSLGGGSQCQIELLSLTRPSATVA